MLDKIRRKVPAPSPRPGQPLRGIPHFQPGDLITAEMLNRLVDALAALDARIAVLESRKP
jgi:hypothetical protein